MWFFCKCGWAAGRVGAASEPSLNPLFSCFLTGHKFRDPPDNYRFFFYQIDDVVLPSGWPFALHLLAHLHNLDLCVFGLIRQYI
jgi:hypothetical protein